MMNYTVEVRTAPVADDWSLHYQAIDAVPGTILLEDAEAPTVMIPVDAESPLKAAQFAQGLATLIGLTIRGANIYPTPEDQDFETDGDDEAGPLTTTATVQRLDAWVKDSEQALCPA